MEVSNIGTRGFADPAVETYRTSANLITLIRTIGSAAIAVFAIVNHSVLLIAVGYLVYWLGDMLDGYVARRFDQETRIGAVGDILCDRICTGLLGIALMISLPWTTAPIIIFLAQFILVDLTLSLQFLRWPILSPNYFHLIDRTLYLWNWSPVAKGTNTASVIILTGLTRSALVGSIMAAVVLVVKIISLARIWMISHAGRPRDSSLIN